ncbi:CAP domain-containing protein [Mucilaginibacter celer]|nr:CAP domain-containing protein [Mucilaginibacter celer]
MLLSADMYRPFLPKKGDTPHVLVIGVNNVRHLKQTDQAAFIESTLKLVNKVRANGCSCGVFELPPASPFTWNDTLYNAALAHANDMLKQGYFSHTSKDGRKAADRIRQAGYTQVGFKTFTVGENIAEGQDGLKEVIADWFKSEGHCKNLMNPKFLELGLAQAGGYWVMEFGGRTIFSRTEQEQIKNGELKIEEK